MANATSTNGLAAHYSTVIGAGGWMMQTPIDASTTEATSAVYYAAGQQEAAASIATTIGVKPSQVLPLTTATPVNGVTGVDVVVVIGQDLASTTTTTTTALLTSPGAGDAAAHLPAPLRPLAAEPARSALFLDFDGTLAAIVEDPAAARPAARRARAAGRPRQPRSRSSRWSRAARPRSCPRCWARPPG